MSLLLLLQNFQLPPPQPVEGRWFLDDFRLRQTGVQLSPDPIHAYQRIIWQDQNSEYLVTDSIPQLSLYPLARIAGGTFYTVHEWFIPRGMRPVKNLSARVQFFNPWSQSAGVPQPGPSSQGYDNDPLLVLYADNNNYVYVSPERYTKRFRIYQQIGGAGGPSFDLGYIGHPNDWWISAPAWRRTIFETLDPLLWSFEVKGKRFSGRIDNLASGLTLWSWDVQLAQSVRWRVGIGARRHWSAAAGWGYVAVDALASGGWDTRSRSLRNLMRGLEDGAERRRR